MAPLPDFSTFFSALWPYDPFPWQVLLAKRIEGGRWPQALNLPTAAGKTACMDAAIYALASQADRPASERTAPRRIWFVVDRRIVVDEAFDRAATIASKLANAKAGPLKEVADRLRQVSGTEQPLAAARLRGGILRDDGWARLPSQPAVITSTVDQLGSRLLFRGYGHSLLTAPIFAGLAANDSLILLDEAHCSVPFLQTLRAIERFRGKEWAISTISIPFAFVILSATPPPDIAKDSVFPGTDRDRALDHPVLAQRLSASKLAELVSVRTNPRKDDPLPKETAERVLTFVREQGKVRVAVVVNRVRTAAKIAGLLRESVGRDVDVVLLTGRLRPFERDRLVDRWKPYLRATAPEQPDRPIILVATQTIEVGADFSFDAMVTEAASLDALRQRFGRLNRMGEPGSAPAVILSRDSEVKEGSEDPIYGNSIQKCWALLDEKADQDDKGKKSGKCIDFGFEALEAALADVDDIEPYLAPRPDAPILLPAHLDLLCQTAPVPRPEPDIQFYLHGKDRGTPEARVVWRADLLVDDPDAWKETVALCPPVCGEMLSVPLYRLRSWLASPEAPDESGDVEGAALSGEDGGDEIQPVLLWRGRDRSQVCRRASGIAPNDVVILPSVYGSSGLGQSEPVEALGKSALDLWEPARKAGGKQAALRLQRSILAPWIGCPPVAALVDLAADPGREQEDLRDAIDLVLAYKPQSEDEPPAPPQWLLNLLASVRGWRLEEHPAGGCVLFSTKRIVRPQTEADLFADDDDILSAVGREVSLPDHTESVERAVEKIATRCLPVELIEPMRRAACWHDAGKLDERFQVMLRQGDESAASSGGPLAKSAVMPESPARRRSIREASGLPGHFRHEMLSLQLAERFTSLSDGDDGELTLHLIASHHGHGRPSTPVDPDPEPPAVHGSHGGVEIAFSSRERLQQVAPWKIDSGIPKRFWRLTRRYGWWGLAYLEAILRLGDWYGSQWVVQEESQKRSAGSARALVARRMKPAGNGEVKPIVLSGLDGSNPLGFLAALGTIEALSWKSAGTLRLSWKRFASWQPVLHGFGPNDQKALCKYIAEALHGDDVSSTAEDDMKRAQKAFDTTKTALTNKKNALKKRRLRGKERQKVYEEEFDPLRVTFEERRKEWLKALKKAVPSPELALGKQINCTAEEYREHAAGFIEDGSLANRVPLDFLAAFASDACLDKSGKKVSATPFCFITGSGHQYFLKTVHELMKHVDIERIRIALFGPWTYSDEKYSMRWDPAEDRRYALMDRDPTATGNKPRTVWMANLLAYRALPLFTSAPSNHGLVTVGWSQGHNSEPFFTWPLWSSPIGRDSIRSLLLLPDLYDRRPDRSSLRARGVEAIFHSRRIRVGTGNNFKINFSNSREV